MLIKYPSDFLEKYKIYEMYFYFDREIPITRLNLTGMHWTLQYMNWANVSNDVDLGKVTKAIY